MSGSCDAERRFEEQLRAREAELDGQEDSDVSALHVGLGLTVLALGVVRLLWRRTTPLPPWAENLSPGSDGRRPGSRRACSPCCSSSPPPDSCSCW